MCGRECSEMHTFDPGCELYVPIPEGMEQAVHWAAGEPIGVRNYHPAEPRSVVAKGDAMAKMRHWIDNAFSGKHMREDVVH